PDEPQTSREEARSYMVRTRRIDASSPDLLLTHLELDARDRDAHRAQVLAHGIDVDGDPEPRASGCRNRAVGGAHQRVTDETRSQCAPSDYEFEQVEALDSREHMQRRRETQMRFERVIDIRDAALLGQPPHRVRRRDAADS